MNKPKDSARKTYQSRDEIEKDFFMKIVKEEELVRGKTESSKVLDEETLRQIQKLFCVK